MAQGTIKKITIILLLLVTSGAATAQKKKLQEATPITVKIKQEISSKTANVGDPLAFQLVSPFHIDSMLAIDTNVIIHGEVIEAVPSKSLGKAGKLDFVISSVQAVDGQIIQLRAEKNLTGKKTTGGVIAAAVIINPLFLFVKGKNIKIETGREFLVYVSRDYEIEVK
jgi:hypothetical protein